jgi:hypothetical protein
MAVLMTSGGVKPSEYKRASDYSVGESVFLNVNGSPKEFIVVNQGLPDATMYDESCDGTWLLMKDCYESRVWHSTESNDYANSEIHAYLNGTFLNLFNKQSVIKQVKIPYVNGIGGSPIASGENGLFTKIFLLACYEIGWTQSVNGNFPIDGAKLDYFTTGNTTAAKSKRIAYYNGTASAWWMRSPYMSNQNCPWTTGSDGSGSNSYSIYAKYVRPALILPFNARFDPETNIIK